ncbi:hypothetical protein TRFO_02581 [Tritrichomonas foetus]|uniref:DH domain-containing protein n=1 Tax=Tritrichomonas foetus TaxID=1144522 RepID=A0A1J4L291_9EUKA|nr:hypothetical protein TRFO_02581 [Tritrichomonas foetus]|eukprot:OHT17530.1 hypothetical protein TRFO_02581 [Tritrichomonas foetus]
MWVCVCSDSSPNVFLDAKTIQHMNAENIQMLVAETYHIYGNVFLRTPNFMIFITNEDTPLQQFPKLAIPEKLDSYSRPNYYIYISTKVDIENIYLYITIRHGTDHKIPKLGVSFSVVEADTINVGELLEKLQTSSKLEFKVKYFLVNGVKVKNDVKVSDFLNYQKFPPLIASVELTPNAIREITHRTQIIKEIIDTEKQYVDDLQQILKFWSPALTKRNMLSPTEHEAIFKDIPSIFNCHSEFLQNLLKIENGYSTCISPLFIQFSEYFKVSNIYISAYPRVNEILDQKSQNKSFVSTLSELRQLIDGRDLSSYLITPVQRMPRYLLFMRELIKRTPVSHPDQELIELSQEKIEETTLSAEAQAERAKQQTLLYKLQEKLKKANVTIVNPSRRIARVFNAFLCNQRKESKAQIYICNDILLIVKDHGRNATLCLITPITLFHYIPILGDFRSMNITTYYKGRCEMRLTFEQTEDRFSFFSLLESQQKEQLPALDTSRYIVWTFDAISETIQPLNGASSISNDRTVVFFGGNGPQKTPSSYFMSYDNVPLDDMILSKMTTIESGIIGRRKHTLNCLNKYLYLIGGLSSEKPVDKATDKTVDKECCEIMRLEIGTGTWSRICSRFSITRYGHTCVVYGTSLIVFGGRNKAGEFFNDVLRIDTIDNNVEKIEVNGEIPLPRAYHSAIVFHDRMYIFGGCNKNGILKDFCMLDLKDYSWKLIRTKKEVLRPYKHHKAFLIGNEMLVIGGETSHGLINSPKPPICQSLSINLLSYEVYKVVDVGNVPYTLKHFGASQISNYNFVVYGGKEGKTPLSAFYHLKLCVSWTEQIQKVIKPTLNTEQLPSELWKNFISQKKSFSVIAHRSSKVPLASISSASSKKGIKFYPLASNDDMSILTQSIERFAKTNDENHPYFTQKSKKYRNSLQPFKFQDEKDLIVPIKLLEQTEKEKTKHTKKWNPASSKVKSQLKSSKPNNVSKEENKELIPQALVKMKENEKRKKTKKKWRPKSK